MRLNSRRGMDMTTGSRTLRDGVVLGLIAYAAVAVFYAAFDVLAARGTLHTVDLLGKATFRGLRDPAVLQLPMKLDPTAIFLYNAVPLVASLAIGCVVAWLIHQAEPRPGSGPLYLYLGAIVVAAARTRITSGAETAAGWRCMDSTPGTGGEWTAGSRPRRPRGPSGSRAGPEGVTRGS